jgi:2-polyprenyl-3-methyl-5-hydroxy-6-metoxy-1,4-benzoquinol methylase
MATYKSFPDNYFGNKVENHVPTREESLKKMPKFRKTFYDFVETLPQGAKVLDSGCGNAKAIKIALSLRPDLQIYGIDISDTSNFLPAGVDFKIGSVDDIDQFYPENFFDAIMQMHVIEHLIFPIDMIISHKKCLKPGGKLYIETPNWVRAFTPFSDIYFYGDYTHIRPFSILTMTKLLSEFDFENIDVKTTNTMTFFNPDDTIASCCHRTVNMKTSTVPSIEKAKLKTKKTFFKKLKYFTKKVFLRFLHPLLKDVLIAVATKPIK